MALPTSLRSLRRSRPTLLRRSTQLLVAAAALLSSTLASATTFQLIQPPRRSNTNRVTVGQATGNNVGINRADCQDTNQFWYFRMNNLLSVSNMVKLEVWARIDGNSCGQRSERVPLTSGAITNCYKVAEFSRAEVTPNGKEFAIRPIQMIHAIYWKQNATEATLDPAVSCKPKSDMQPTTFALHFLAMDGQGEAIPAQSTGLAGILGSSGTSGSTGGSSGSFEELYQDILYDLGGPEPPSGLELHSGNNILMGEFSIVTNPVKDFMGYRAYCFPTQLRPGAGTPIETPEDTGGPVEDDTTTDTESEGVDASDVDASDGAAVDADDAGDGATIDADDAGADATGDDASTDTDAAFESNDFICEDEHFKANQPPEPEDEQYRCDESASSNGRITIRRGPGGTALANNQFYSVALSAYDKQGNSGVFSKPVCQRPRATLDFFRQYRDAQGKGGGGYCGVGAAPGFAGTGAKALAAGILALAGLGVLRRRRGKRRGPSTGESCTPKPWRMARWFGPLALALAASSWTGRADADEKSASWERQLINEERNRPRVTTSFRFGAYHPRVDDSFENAKPYESVMGKSMRFMVGGEVDWHALWVPAFGSIGVGGLFGYFKSTAAARFADDNSLSKETTGFEMWLLSVVAVAQFDLLLRRTPIPLVPYAKAGPATALWTTFNGLGTSQYQGTKGRGQSPGMLYGLGAMLMINFLDPQAARNFEVQQSVKGSYLFGELTYTDLSGMGQSTVMNVSDFTWNVGLALAI